jgi:hypothetical protein
VSVTRAFVISTRTNITISFYCRLQSLKSNPPRQTKIINLK